MKIKMTHCAAENVFFIIIHCVIGASSQISEMRTHNFVVAR